MMGSERATRILLVDDDSSSRFLVRASLEDHADLVEVVAEAASAEEALAAIDDARPDVVVLDAVMPRMDGFALAAAIRARTPSPGILMLSSFVDDVIRAKARAAGVDACLDKGEHHEIARVARTLMPDLSQEPGASATHG